MYGVYHHEISTHKFCLVIYCWRVDRLSWRFRNCLPICATQKWCHCYAIASKQPALSSLTWPRWRCNSMGCAKKNLHNYSSVCAGTPSFACALIGNCARWTKLQVKSQSRIFLVGSLSRNDANVFPPNFRRYVNLFCPSLCSTKFYFLNQDNLNH